MPDEHDSEPSKDKVDATVRDLLGDSVMPPEDDMQRLEALDAPFDHDDLPHVDDELDQKIKDLQDRAGKLKQQNKRFEEKTQVYKEDPAATQGLGFGLILVYVLLGFTVLGWIIGLIVTRLTGSAANSGYCVLGGVLVGGGIAFYLIQADAKQRNK